MELGRREFLGALAAASAVSGCTTGGARGGDADVSVFLSDLHVEGAQPAYKYSKARLEKTVDEILAMSPRPGRVVCFGDIACSYGLESDYIEAKRILSRLEDAGIPVHFTMGNHDRRGMFFKYWPECEKRSPVPGRCVSVVDLGSADLVLLDALKGADDRPLKDMGPVEGTLDPAQLKWFEDFVAGAKRPFFVGSHQFHDLYIEKPSPIRRAAKSRFFAGWIYGHDHVWKPDFHPNGWAADAVVSPSLCLPSSGLWGDIGYVVFRTYADGAEAELKIQDFYFPTPRAQRPGFWDVHLGDRRGSRMRFAYEM